MKLGDTLEVFIKDLSEIAGNKARQAVPVKSSAACTSQVKSTKKSKRHAGLDLLDFHCNSKCACRAVFHLNDCLPSTMNQRHLHDQYFFFFKKKSHSVPKSSFAESGWGS